MLYEDLNDPTGIGLLTFDEDPGYFLGTVRPLVTGEAFSGLRFREEFTMLGRTYSMGWEADLEEALITRPKGRLCSPELPWAIWYPLRRSGAFEELAEKEQRAVLAEHGGVGQTFGKAGVAHDIRLACHGLSKDDNDFVIGLLGRRAVPAVRGRPADAQDPADLPLPRAAWARFSSAAPRGRRLAHERRPEESTGFRLPEGLPPRARAAHAGLAHAPGGPVSPRVSRPERAPLDDGAALGARARRRGDPPAPEALPAGRGDHLHGHPPAAGRHGSSSVSSETGTGKARASATPSPAPATSTCWPSLPPAEALGAHLEAIAMACAELHSSGTPLIGFTGAPFTLASYAIEGSGSRNYAKTKALMYAEPAAWRRLMSKLVTVLADFLIAQARAGASALQVFDSWAGIALGRDDYVRYVQPYNRQLFSAVQAAGVPVINFSTGTAAYIEEVAACGGDVVGVDWRMPIDSYRSRIGPDQAIQGNLDPVALLAPWRELEPRIEAILASAGGSGHLFNLGHGILPETPMDAVARLVDHVHAWNGSPRDERARRRAAHGLRGPGFPGGRPRLSRRHPDGPAHPPRRSWRRSPITTA